MSLCAVISCTGIIHCKLVDDTYNTDVLQEAFQNGDLNQKQVLIMDNVKLHHCEDVK